MDHLDKISVKELQDIINKIKENKPTQHLLTVIAYRNGILQIELAEGRTPGEERSTDSLCDSIQTDRLSKLW